MPKYITHKLIKDKSIEFRLFQKLIADKMIDKGNSLVVLPTALGKTVIAVLVAADFLLKFPSKKILFLAPTKPLALQHKKRFSSFLSIPENKIILLTGEIIPEKRINEIKDAKVVCATPQTIENDLIHKRISLNDFSLIIFDEAHRAVKDYAYVFIAKSFKNNSKGLILGLTASPGSEREKIQDICRNLFIENIEVKTLNDADIKPFAQEIKLEWLKVELPMEFKEIISLLNQFLKEKISELKRAGIIKGSVSEFISKKRLLALQKKISSRISNNAIKQPSLFGAAIKIAELLKASHALLLIETQGVNALNSYFKRIKSNYEKKTTKSDIAFYSNKLIQKVMQKTTVLAEKKTVHPKLLALIDFLKDYFSNENNARVIIFNHYRDSVERLVSSLKKEGIKAEAFVGQANKPQSKGLTQKEQAKKIKDFSSGLFNVLVATSVAEEGIDIPSCDLVILFEPVPSEIRHIQRIGRTGRIHKGRALILITKGTRDETFYWVAKRKEKKMYHYLNEFKETKNKMKQQATLKLFSEPKNDFFILADTRENASKIILLLKQKKINVKVKQLDVGDYVINNEIVIERKSTSDFLSSLIDGRLFNQLQSMTVNYDKPLLLIEGHPNELFSLRNIHPNAVIGALSSIALKFRVPILFTKDINETAQFIYIIAKRALEGKTNDLRLRVEKPSMSLNEQQRFIIESLPSIGPRTAKLLLKKFGSVKNVFTASLKELLQVENIGEKKAKKIKKIIDSNFKEEK